MSTNTSALQLAPEFILCKGQRELAVGLAGRRIDNLCLELLTGARNIEIEIRIVVATHCFKCLIITVNVLRVVAQNN